MLAMTVADLKVFISQTERWEVRVLVEAIPANSAQGNLRLGHQLKSKDFFS